MVTAVRESQAEPAKALESQLNRVIQHGDHRHDVSASRMISATCKDTQVSDADESEDEEGGSGHHEPADSQASSCGSDRFPVQLDDDYDTSATSAQVLEPSHGMADCGVSAPRIAPARSAEGASASSARPGDSQTSGSTTTDAVTRATSQQEQARLAKAGLLTALAIGLHNLPEGTSKAMCVGGSKYNYTTVQLLC